jgi:alkylhydroperoxidase family enzyme
MTEPRLPPLQPEEWTDQQRSLVEPLQDGDTLLNIYGTLVRHPDLFRRWLGFGTQVLLRSSLAPRDRELIILRTGWVCGSDYEFGQHRVIGRLVGLSDDEIDRVPRGEDAAWTDRERLLFAAVDQLVEGRDVDDTTWEALDRDLTTEQVLDLVFTVGQYVLVSTALRTLRVQREPGVDGFPEP